jgi:hypothetical protein
MQDFFIPPRDLSQEELSATAVHRAISKMNNIEGGFNIIDARLRASGRRVYSRDSVPMTDAEAREFRESCTVKMMDILTSPNNTGIHLRDLRTLVTAITDHMQLGPLTSIRQGYSGYYIVDAILRFMKSLPDYKGVFAMALQHTLLDSLDAYAPEGSVPDIHEIVARWKQDYHNACTRRSCAGGITERFVQHLGSTLLNQDPENYVITESAIESKKRRESLLNAWVPEYRETLGDRPPNPNDYKQFVQQKIIGLGENPGDWNAVFNAWLVSPTSHFQYLGGKRKTKRKRIKRKKTRQKSK